MTYKVIFTPLARLSLQEITSYIGLILDNPTAANKLASKIYRSTDNLEIMPYMYPVYREEPLKSRGVRYYTVNMHNVFYRVDEPAKTVYILKICYAKQSPDNQMDGI